MRGRQVREVSARESSSRSVSPSQPPSAARLSRAAAVAGASLAREPKPARPVGHPNPQRPTRANPFHSAAERPAGSRCGPIARRAAVRGTVGGGAQGNSAATRLWRGRAGALHLRCPDPRRAPNPRDLDTRLARPPARRASPRQPPEPPLRAAAPLGGRSRADFGGAGSRQSRAAQRRKFWHLFARSAGPMRPPVGGRPSVIVDHDIFFAGRLVPALRI